MTDNITKAKASLIGDIVKFIEKILKTHHMYQGKHPNLENFRQEVLKLMIEYHEKYEEDIIVNISPRGYQYQGILIYEEENISNSNVYYLYKMGVKTIIFAKNILDTEVKRFIDILTYKKSDSDDIITLLWEADFRTILYNKVETFYESNTEEKLDFEQFAQWIRKKEAPIQKEFEAFGFDFSKKKKKYKAKDLKKEIEIKDNEKLFEELKEKNKIEILETDKEFVFNNLKFDKKELPQRWSNMMSKVAFKYIENHEEYIDYIYQLIDVYIEASNYKSLYFIFYDFKTNYEAEINKKKYVKLLKRLYIKLIEPERLNKIAKELSNLTEENYYDFVLFLKELNPSVLNKFVDNFANIEERQIRDQLINELKAINFDLTSYYKSLLNSSNFEYIIEGLEGVRVSRKIDDLEKIGLYKTTMEYKIPEVDVYLLELLKGYYEDDIFMSNFFFRLLKSNNVELLARVIIYIDSVNNDALFLKAAKFIETPSFLSWRVELKKEYLAVLVRKLGLNIKSYLLALFDSKALKGKRGFDDLKLAIIYSFSFLLDKDIINFLKSVSKKLMNSKQLKEEALQSIERMKNVIDNKQRQ